MLKTAKSIIIPHCLLALLTIGARVTLAVEEPAVQEPPPLSDETEECLGCHEEYTPGIVGDWLSSRHAVVTPEQALKKPLISRRISSDSIPDGLRHVIVGCYECHSLNPENHTDNFEHFDHQINVVVSPNDCSTCHPVEVGEYVGSKKANALDILEKNPLYHTLVETITGLKTVEDGDLVHMMASDATKGETCYGCHGTRVSVRGMVEIDTDLGEIEIPDLMNWPNQGVGRVNPDGSLGSCSACHPRHNFSIEIARKPYTCIQCHLEPDVPAWDVYRESKHGNIFLSLENKWNWNQMPWRVGLDFTSPACAACHNSLLTTQGGEIVAERTHDFGARLWVRIFGLIYSHPQPKDGRTYQIQNPDGLPLPTTFTGVRASEYLIDHDEQEKRKSMMVNICRSCHSTDWAVGFFEKMESTITETDQMTKTATRLVVRAWDEGLADGANPFDEVIEQMWINQWLFYANSIRYASAMSGPDYASFKNGWWQSTHNLKKMEEWIAVKDKEE
jgi:hypothetical protein